MKKPNPINMKFVLLYGFMLNTIQWLYMGNTMFVLTSVIDRMWLVMCDLIVRNWVRSFKRSQTSGQYSSCVLFGLFYMNKPNCEQFSLITFGPYTANIFQWLAVKPLKTTKHAHLEKFVHKGTQHLVNSKFQLR